MLPYDYLAPAVACDNNVDARSRQRRLLAFGNEGAVGSIYGKRACCGNESSAIETEGCLAGGRGWIDAYYFYRAVDIVCGRA